MVCHGEQISPRRTAAEDPQQEVKLLGTPLVGNQLQEPSGLVHGQTVPTKSLLCWSICSNTCWADLSIFGLVAVHGPQWLTMSVHSRYEAIHSVSESRSESLRVGRFSRIKAIKRGSDSRKEQHMNVKATVRAGGGPMIIVQG